MAKTTEEDTPDLVEETMPEPEAVLEVEEAEEVILDDEKAPVKKKVAALKARHRLEDYFEMKRIQDELDYLDDEKKRKAALLLKVAQQAKLEKVEKESKHKSAKEVKEPKPIKEIKETKEAKETKMIKQAKPKAKPKTKAKPKSKPKKKAKK